MTLDVREHQRVEVLQRYRRQPGAGHKRNQLGYPSSSSRSGQNGTTTIPNRRIQPSGPS